MKQIIKLFTLLTTSILLLAACGPTPPEPEETREVTEEGTTETAVSDISTEEEHTTNEEGPFDIALFVGSELAECTGEAPQTCMMVKNSPEEEYTYFYDQIEGFEYEEGYEYELTVQVTPVENPPADASSLKYSLVEIVSKTAVEPATSETSSLDGNAWQLESYAVDGAQVDATEGGVYTFTAKEGENPAQMDAHTGCNNISATYTDEGDTFKFGMGISTAKACGDAMDEQEQAIQAGLESSASYHIEGDSLQMMDADGNVTLQFSALEAVSLTDTLWQATGINNGTGGVTSVLAETTVTAVFAADNTLSGNASCNMYNTTYEASDGEMSISPSIVTTRRACTEPITTQEGQYLTALANATSYKIVGDKLELRDADGSLQVSYVAIPATPLVGTTWEAVSYNSGGQATVSVMSGSRITAVFNEDDTLNGNSGCNTYFASYELSGADGLTIGGVGNTMMACLDDNVMTQEVAYLTALGTVTTYSISDNKLELRTADGTLAVSYVAAQVTPLADSEWDVLSHNNGKGGVTTSIIGTQMTMNFDADGGVNGSAGCNNYFGSYEAGSELLTFGPIASTEMFCAEPEGVMDQEAEFLAALATVNSYHIDGDRMTLRDENGSTAVELQKSISIEETAVVGMANPASVYCEENGGTLEIRTDADGGQFGMCLFDDGSECEEWAFFSGTCGATE